MSDYTSQHVPIKSLTISRVMLDWLRERVSDKELAQLYSTVMPTSGTSWTKATPEVLYYNVPGERNTANTSEIYRFMEDKILHVWTHVMRNSGENTSNDKAEFRAWILKKSQIY